MNPFTNSPVFPTSDIVAYKGLSKRELFAAIAMQGLVADDSSNFTAKSIAIWAVKQADALIAELCKS